jgi:ribosome-associated protein
MMQISYARSGGPGGQHANKVSTKAVVKVDINRLVEFDEDIVDKIKNKYPNKINKEGELFTSSETTRKQDLNLKECVEKLEELLVDVIAGEPPREVHFFEESKD